MLYVIRHCLNADMIRLYSREEGQTFWEYKVFAFGTWIEMGLQSGDHSWRSPTLFGHTQIFYDANSLDEAIEYLNNLGYETSSACARQLVEEI